MKNMVVTNRNFNSYGTRRLKAGDTFSAEDRHAKILILAGLAEYAEAIDYVSRYCKDCGQVYEPGHKCDSEQLKEKYKRISGGSMPDGRWSERRLKEEIAKLML